MTVTGPKTRAGSFNRKGAFSVNKGMKTVFEPIFPVVARNALGVTGITSGICLDIGSGLGMLALAIARETPEMEVISFDVSENFQSIARRNFKKAGLSSRIRAVQGDVHAMPFENWYADLIVSRGSMFLWKNLMAAFSEIMRVLKPGGATYIGGGFGNLALHNQVVAEILIRDPKWNFIAGRKAGAEDIERFKEMFEILGCSTYRIINDETGFWIILSKPL